MYYDSVFNDLFRINRELSSFLNSGRIKRGYSWPELNLYESKEGYTVALRVPGIAKEDIEISYKDNSLKISGEKKVDINDKASYHLREREEGAFERNIVLRDKIEADKIGAQLENGILIIKVPKSPEAKPKNININ